MSNKIKELRKALNLTQEQFSVMVGVTRKTICAYETGKSSPNAEHLATMTEIFNVSPNEILNRKGARESNDTK